MNDRKASRRKWILFVIMTVINTIRVTSTTKRSTTEEILQEGIRVQDSLINDLTINWGTIAEKLGELEYFEQTGWEATSHPFAQMRYKIFNNTMTFKVATRNCMTHQSFLLHGDPDKIDIIEGLATDTRVWISIQDTEAIRTMEEAEIQKFLDEATVCHTIKKTSDNAIVPEQTRCEEQQQSICIRLLKKYQETRKYKQELTKIKEISNSINTEDKPLNFAIGRLLKLGSPLKDKHHPAQLQQTMNLLIATANTVTNLTTNIPILPKLNDIMFQIQNTRNTQHTTLLLLLAQHLINYATKIEALTETYKQTKTEQSDNIEEGEDGMTSAIGEEEYTYQNSVKLQEIETTMDRTQGEMTTMRNKYEQLKTQVNRMEKMTQDVNQNKIQIKTTNTQIKGLSHRLSAWINRQAAEAFPDEDVQIIEESVNNTISKITQFAIDFLEDETNLWIATTITLVLTMVAIVNAVCMCVYIKKTSRRNTEMKTHLQMKQKYNQDEDVERPLVGTRIEKIERRVLDLEKKLIEVQQGIREKSNPTNRTKKRKKAAPQPEQRRE